MNSLEFIEKQIDIYISVKNRAILQIPDEDNEIELCKLQDKIDICNERISYFYQIKSELEEYQKLKDKTTPKKVIKENNIYGYHGLNVIDFVCPKCGLKIDFDDDYCKKCGQKLDWSKENNE